MQTSLPINYDDHNDVIKGNLNNLNPVNNVEM